MKKLLLFAVTLTAFALSIPTVHAQTAQATKMTLAEAKANMVKQKPGTAEAKAAVAVYERLKNESKAPVTQKKPKNIAMAKAKPQAKAVAATVPSTSPNTYAQLQAYQKAHPINEPNKRIRYIRTMEQQRDFYLQNGDAATAAKINNDIANFKAEVRKNCPNCWTGEGEKPVGQ